MRLLFDENLSFRLVRELADVYPDSVHVRDVGGHAKRGPREKGTDLFSLLDALGLASPTRTPSPSRAEPALSGSVL
ncbi:MAG: DUF5615 family PIN-like protein [Gammaproteobacteria bacterium]